MNNGQPNPNPNPPTTIATLPPVLTPDAYATNLTRISQMKAFLAEFEASNESGLQRYMEAERALQQQIEDGLEAQRRLAELRTEGSVFNNGNVASSSNINGTSHIHTSSHDNSRSRYVEGTAAPQMAYIGSPPTQGPRPAWMTQNTLLTSSATAENLSSTHTGHHQGTPIHSTSGVQHYAAAAPNRHSNAMPSGPGAQFSTPSHPQPHSGNTLRREHASHQHQQPQWRPAPLGGSDSVRNAGTAAHQANAAASSAFPSTPISNSSSLLGALGPTSAEEVQHTRVTYSTRSSAGPSAIPTRDTTPTEKVDLWAAQQRIIECIKRCPPSSVQLIMEQASLMHSGKPINPMLTQYRHPQNGTILDLTPVVNWVTIHMKLMDRDTILDTMLKVKQYFAEVQRLHMAHNYGQINPSNQTPSDQPVSNRPISFKPPTATGNSSSYQSPHVNNVQPTPNILTTASSSALPLASSRGHNQPIYATAQQLGLSGPLSSEHQASIDQASSAQPRIIPPTAQSSRLLPSQVPQPIPSAPQPNPSVSQPITSPNLPASQSSVPQPTNPPVGHTPLLAPISPNPSLTSQSSRQWRRADPSTTKKPGTPLSPANADKTRLARDIMRALGRPSTSSDAPLAAKPPKRNWEAIMEKVIEEDIASSPTSKKRKLSLPVEDNGPTELAPALADMSIDHTQAMDVPEPLPEAVPELTTSDGSTVVEPANAAPVSAGPQASIASELTVLEAPDLTPSVPRPPSPTEPQPAVLSMLLMEVGPSMPEPPLSPIVPRSPLVSQRSAFIEEIIPSSEAEEEDGEEAHRSALVPGTGVEPSSHAKLPLFLPSPSSSSNSPIDMDDHRTEILSNSVHEFVLDSNLLPSQTASTSRVTVRKGKGKLAVWDEDDMEAMRYENDGRRRPQAMPLRREVYVMVPPKPAWAKKYDVAVTRRTRRRSPSQTSVDEIEDWGHGEPRKPVRRGQTRMSVDEIEDWDNEDDEKRSRKDEATKAVITAARKGARMVDCRWRDCNASLFSLERLAFHAEGHAGEREHEGKYWCDWQNCTRRFTSRASLAKHLRAHTSKLFYCTFQGCDETFETTIELMKHHKSSMHRNGHFRVPPRLSHPILNELPPLEERLPSYLLTAPSFVVAHPLSQQEHAWLGPQVLRNIMCFHHSGKRSDAARPTRSARRLSDRIREIELESVDPETARMRIRRMAHDEYDAFAEDPPRKAPKPFDELPSVEVSRQCGEGLVLWLDGEEDANSDHEEGEGVMRGDESRSSLAEPSTVADLDRSRQASGERDADETDPTDVPSADPPLTAIAGPPNPPIVSPGDEPHPQGVGLEHPDADDSLPGWTVLAPSPFEDDEEKVELLL